METVWVVLERADDIFKFIFWNECILISINTLLNLVPKCQINNSSNGSDNGLVPCLNNRWYVYRRIYASLGLNELKITHCQLPVFIRDWLYKVYARSYVGDTLFLFKADTESNVLQVHARCTINGIRMQCADILHDFLNYEYALDHKWNINMKQALTSIESRRYILTYIRLLSELIRISFNLFHDLFLDENIFSWDHLCRLQANRKYQWTSTVNEISRGKCH